ncbi:MAG: hypothetical protein WEB00_15755 [Dehalococcoidia bacterium]
MVRWLIVPMLLLAATHALHTPPEDVEAKGPMDMIIGGGELAPYFMAAGESPGGMVFPSLPQGSLPEAYPAPPNGNQLLAASYSIYFDAGEILYVSPSMSYVPVSLSSPAYFVWRSDCWWAYPCSRDQNYWLEAPEGETDYIDREIRRGIEARANDGEGISLDPLQALLRYGSGATWLISHEEYLIGRGPDYYMDYMYGSAGWNSVAEGDLERLNEAIFNTLTLDRWIEAGSWPWPEPGPSAVTVAAPSGGRLFTLENIDGRAVISTDFLFPGYFEVGLAVSPTAAPSRTRSASISQRRAGPLVSRWRSGLT